MHAYVAYFNNTSFKSIYKYRWVGVFCRAIPESIIFIQILTFGFADKTSST